MSGPSRSRLLSEVAWPSASGKVNSGARAPIASMGPPEWLEIRSIIAGGRGGWARLGANSRGAGPCAVPGRGSTGAEEGFRRAPRGTPARLDLPHLGARIARLAWGGSSAGRASRSQCEGRGFDPLPLHQVFKGTFRSHR